MLQAIEETDVMSLPQSFDESQLVLGDATDSSLFEMGKFNLTITSPPYNVGMSYDNSDDGGEYDAYLEFSRRWLANCYLWSADHGRLCMNIPLDKNNGGKQAVTADLTTIAREVGWQYQTTIIWNEGTISRRTAWGSWCRPSAPHVIAPVETIVVLYKDDWKRPHLGDDKVTIEPDEFKDWTLGIWQFNGESAKAVGHPAPFPVELPRRCIRLYSYKGDNILDPFAGSGTTLVAALRDEREPFGVELSEEYRVTALDRIRKERRLV